MHNKRKNFKKVSNNINIKKVLGFKRDKSYFKYCIRKIYSFLLICMKILWKFSFIYWLYC